MLFNVSARVADLPPGITVNCQRSVTRTTRYMRRPLHAACVVNHAYKWPDAVHITRSRFIGQLVLVLSIAMILELRTPLYLEFPGVQTPTGSSFRRALTWR